MTRPLPMKLTPQTPIKVLRVERSVNQYNSFEDLSHDWMIWLTANGDFTLGTFIQLCDNGDVNRVTWHEDGTETIFNMKEEDNEAD